MRLRNIYNRLRYPGETLSHRVAHGGFWMFAFRIVDRGFGLIRTIVLARLLAPNDFGLFGIAMLALTVLDSFSRTGFDRALIQKKEDIESYLDSAWTVQVIRGLALAVILVVVAPLVGIFFEEPSAINLVRVLAVSVFISSFRNIGIVFFAKELEFHRQFAYEFSGTLADFSVAISVALIFHSVWALLFGVLARNFVQLIVSYLVHHYRPNFKLDLEKSKDLLNFGRWILGSSIVIFIAAKGDDVFLGKVLGATALGFYLVAYRLSNVVAKEITYVISQVMFPAYSKLQQSLLNLKKAFMKTFKVTVFLTIPLAVGIFLLIPEFTTLFLGEKWLPIIWPVRILLIAGLLRSISCLWDPLYWARGIPNYAFKKNVWRVIATFVPIYFLTTKFGISGTSGAVVLGMFAAFAFDIYYIKFRSRLDFSLIDIFKSLLPPIVGSALFSVLILWLKFTVGINLVLLIIIILASIGLYIAGIYLFQMVFKFSPLQDLTNLLESIRK